MVAAPSGHIRGLPVGGVAGLAPVVEGIVRRTVKSDARGGGRQQVEPAPMHEMVFASPPEPAPEAEVQRFVADPPAVDAALAPGQPVAEEMDSTQLTRQLDDLVELIEERILTELERRGGRFEEVL